MEQMDLTQFGGQLAGRLKDSLPPSLQNLMMQMEWKPKLNGMEKPGLSLMLPGEPMGAVLYLSEYYEAFQQGASWEAILQEAAHGCSRAMEQQKAFAGSMQAEAFDPAAHPIALQLVNRNRNRRLLQEVPCRMFGDFAMVYRICVPAEPGSQASILLDKRMQQRLSLLPEALHEQAVRQSQELLEPTFSPLMGLAMGQSARLLSESPSEACSPEPYVLSNTKVWNGAAALLYPGVPEQLEERMGAGYYLLPSSIHEWMVLPRDCGLTEREMQELVRSANQDAVAAEEFLGDRAYQYDRRQQRLVPAAGLQKQREERMR